MVTSDGASRRADAIILATGFETTSFLAPMEIEGPAGLTLNEAWKDGVEAYLGVAVTGFPNLFMMYGPNTNLGHSSVLFMLECQAHYIVDCVRHMTKKRLKLLEVRRDVMARFNENLQRELDRTVWVETGPSWYKTADGRITTNWARSTARYWWRTRRMNPTDYDGVAWPSI